MARRIRIKKKNHNGVDKLFEDMQEAINVAYRDNDGLMMEIESLKDYVSHMEEVIHRKEEEIKNLRGEIFDLREERHRLITKCEE